MDSQELQRIKNRYDIVGNDPALNRAIEMAVAIAPTDLTVLILGESGVGKENIPRIIHQNSARRNSKFLAVNCGAIPEGTINAELFGHEKGAFTGAIGERKGYFEEADGGTIFLDEIGELPKETQSMLLRVLQNGEYMKVGSSKVEKTDVRVIAATNVNLMNAVSRGKFREDLYYRINAMQITMPALRERKDDIYLLFRKFTSDFSEKNHVCKISLTHEAITLLRDYRWPGNVRQLKNIAETVSALESSKLSPRAERCEIDAETLAKYIPKEVGNTLPATLEHQVSFDEDEKKMVYKAILDLKRDVDALKAVVYGRDGQHRSLPAPEPVADDPEEILEAEWQDSGEPAAEAEIAADRKVEITASDKREPQPVREIPVPDNLSLHKISEELILKALEKHNGNRKLAAEELGISERTLYRKLSKNGRK
jgi:transcriptional regulator with PAS, ATPase and Fis domain